MPNIIPDNRPGEYRVDIITGTKYSGTHHFTAPAGEATDTARRIVASLGGTHGYVYTHDRGTVIDYHGTVEVDR